MEEIKNEDILLKIYEEQKNIKEEILGLKEEMSVLKGDVSVLKEDMSDLKAEVRNISRTVAKIEVEHGEKLQILFDAFQSQEEKKEELKKRIKICEKKIDKQGDKIYYLSSIVNKK